LSGLLDRSDGGKIRAFGTGLGRLAGSCGVILREGSLDFVVNFVFWLLFATLYLGPSIVAVCRNHYRTPLIVAVNVLLGWTIVGLFWAFAWALSSTRPDGATSTRALPTDFAEKLFQNRNIIRQPDGGAIIYPGLLAEEAYWLNAKDFQSYIEMRADDSHRNFPRALLLLICGASLYLAFRQWMGSEHGMAPAILSIITFTLAVTAWDLVFRPRRRFLAAFPKAPRTQDPIRRQRKTLAGLVAFDPLLCLGATLLSFGLIASTIISLWPGNRFSLLRSQDGAMLILGFTFLSVSGSFYAHLGWHHILFFLNHRRTPVQADLDALGTGVKAPRPIASVVGTPTDGPAPMSGTRRSPGRGLAAALRLGARQG
jgi:Superinfection immunity protein